MTIATPRPEMPADFTAVEFLGAAEGLQRERDGEKADRYADPEIRVTQDCHDSGFLSDRDCRIVATRCGDVVCDDGERVGTRTADGSLCLDSGR